MVLILWLPLRKLHESCFRETELAPILLLPRMLRTNTDGSHLDAQQSNSDVSSGTSSTLQIVAEMLTDIRADQVKRNSTSILVQLGLAPGYLSYKTDSYSYSSLYLPPFFLLFFGFVLSHSSCWFFPRPRLLMNSVAKLFTWGVDPR